MDWDNVAPMLVFITLILTVGGVIVLRPLSKQLAELLHAMTQERMGVGRTADTQRLHEQVARLEARLELLEDRQSFTDSLLEARRAPDELGSRSGPVAEGLRSLRSES